MLIGGKKHEAGVFRPKDESAEEVERARLEAVEERARLEAKLFSMQFGMRSNYVWSHIQMEGFVGTLNLLFVFSPLVLLEVVPDADAGLSVRARVASHLLFAPHFSLILVAVLQERANTHIDVYVYRNKRKRASMLMEASNQTMKRAT